MSNEDLQMVRVIKRYYNDKYKAVVCEDGRIYSMWFIRNPDIDKYLIGEFLWGYIDANRSFIPVKRATYEERNEREELRNKDNLGNDKMNIFNDDIFSEFDFEV